jgi:flavin reductase (DIM6/NTAB) family NADH-FMN oxidoreductase RutF
MPDRLTPPSEFDLPLSGTAVWAGPDGLGDSSFDDLPEPTPLELPAALGDDPRIALRKTLGMFATGVTVITTREGDQVHGMTANAFMSVSLEPPLVLISVDRRTRMCGLLYGGRNFGVSVLSEGQAALSDRFAGRPALEGTAPRFEVVHDTPLVEGALAHFVANVDRSYWGGDHSLFLGRVEYAHYREDGAPLLFHGGRYERLTPAAGNPIIP